MIGQFLTSLGCPEGSQEPKKEDFQKLKQKTPGIHVIYKFTQGR